jgi:hypothetical protein
MSRRLNVKHDDLAVPHVGTEHFRLFSVMGVARLDDCEPRQKRLQVEPHVAFGRRFAPPVLGPVHVPDRCIAAAEYVRHAAPSGDGVVLSDNDDRVNCIREPTNQNPLHAEQTNGARASPRAEAREGRRGLTRSV